MSRLRRFSLGAALTAAAVIFGAGGSSAAVSVMALPGHVPAQIRTAAILQSLPPDEIVELSLVVRPDQALLDKTLAELYGPNAGPNRKFLTPAEFAQKFDLARKRQALKDFASAAGLAVDAAADRPGSLLVNVSGPASRVNQAFGVRLNSYRAADGQVFRANATDPLVPVSLAPDLNAVVGLSNFRGARKPHVSGFRPVAARSVAGIAPSAAAPAALSGGSGPGGGLAPADIQTIYGLSGTLTGSGQNVAILEFDGYNPADIAHYQATFGLGTAPVTFMSVSGQANLCGSGQNLPCNTTTLAGDQGGMAEVALDIEMVLALVPGASNVLVYTGPNTTAGTLAIYNAVATDNTAKVFSISWGMDLASAYGNSASEMTSESLVFQQMAAQGQTVFAAAGDAGAYDALGNTTLIVDNPAAQPYVTGVGGTTLTGSVSAPVEATWNQGYNSGTGRYWAGGGGIANYVGGSTTFWPLPTYQSGIAGTQSQSFRNVPDVSLNADGSVSPYIIYLGGAWYYSGGTSAAAPLWTALAAQINQKRGTYGNGPLGFANTPLYKLAASSSYGTVFKDVTTGNNGFYTAGTGYDNATGLGSFKGDALINALGVPPASAPTGLSAATLGVSSIQWTWSAVSGALGYDVYYATNPSQSLALAIQPPFTQTGLLADTTYGIMVRAEHLGGEGPSASITTATYAAAPGALLTYAGFSSSGTFTYSACPAAPNPLSCAGYIVQASTAADFSGAVFSSATAVRTLTQLSITTLNSNTNYAVRLGALNPLGAVTWGAVTASINTGTSLVPPVNPVLDLVSTGTIRFSWSQGTNPSGLTYIAQASTASNYTGTLLSQTVTSFNASFAGLPADTSHYFRVQAVGGPFLTVGPTATLALAPLVSTTPFVAVGTTGLTAAWANPGNQADALYKADLFLDAAFSTLAQSTSVRTTAAVFTGLSANTAYYARAQAISRGGAATVEVPLGSTSTLVQTPSLPGQPFSALATNGFAFAFLAAGNSAGTNYFVRVSTDPGFSVLAASATTTALTASFTSLLSNQPYYVSVAGLNQYGTPTAFVGASTATAVAAPGPAAVAITTRNAASFGFAWSPGTLAPGTSYVAQVSSSPAFAFSVTSSATANAFATLAGLQPNTTYYARVQAVSLSANPAGPFLSAASGSTLANPPGAAATPFPMVAFTSMTVAWTPLPVSPSSAAAEGYRVELSTAPDFSSVSVTSAVTPGASTATLTGLAIATTYYARVASLSWEGLPDYLVVSGSTRTGTPALSSGTLTSAGLTLIVTPDSPALTQIRVDVAPGTFPLDTLVSAITSVGLDVAGARSNEAAALTPFGPPTAFDLSASGLQPAAPVRLTIAYDPAQIPPGQDERRLHLWRYDPASGQWTLVPSQADPSAHVLIASVQHFSSFAPFFVTAGTGLGSVQVFPQPWEVGDPNSRYWASQLSFSGLPAAAAVRLFTVTGEEVFSGTASAGGIFTWDGNTRFGRRAASGTYYAEIEAAGAKLVRRVVLIR